MLYEGHIETTNIKFTRLFFGLDTVEKNTRPTRPTSRNEILFCSLPRGSERIFEQSRNQMTAIIRAGSTGARAEAHMSE